MFWTMLTALVSIAVQPAGTFRMEMPVSPETTDGQRLLAMRAIEHCAGLYPVLGRYRFSGTERVSPGEDPELPRFVVEQEITCVDRPPEPSIGVEIASDWQASEADTQRAVEATHAYFAAVDAGDVGRLEGMMTPGQRETSSTAERAGQLAEFRTEAGIPGEHRVARVTWYVNPQGVPAGAYAAVDFDRRYSNLAVSCGYVVWHRQADGRLLLVREEAGHAPNGSLSTDAAQLSQIRAQLRCRD